MARLREVVERDCVQFVYRWINRGIGSDFKVVYVDSGDVQWVLPDGTVTQVQLNHVWNVRGVSGIGFEPVTQTVFIMPDGTEEFIGPGFQEVYQQFQEKHRQESEE